MTGNDDEEDICGEPCKSGGACQHPASEPDGSCWLPTHGEGDPEDSELHGEVGRPSKMTHERVAAICDDLAQGFSNKVAARTNGIAQGTFQEWKAKGKQYKKEGKENQYTDFYERIERAKAQGERMWTENAYKYARDADSFGAVMEILRKRYPDSWTAEAHEDEDSGSLTVVLSDESGEPQKQYAMTPEQAEGVEPDN